MPLGNSNLPEFFGYLWVMDLQKGMGYWLSESMGYACKMPTNQHGSPGNVWVTGEYGLSGVWLIGETTVPATIEKDTSLLHICRAQPKGWTDIACSLGSLNSEEDE